MDLPFDEAIGGGENLSASFSLREFATPRVEEILMLSETLNEEPTKGLLFQRLPKNMRRRQMSHHQSRLPRNLRYAFSAQLKSPTNVRSSRRFRRKPRFLLSENSRIKKRDIWLETHIWHAKRFHMTNKWGYRLPDRPTNRGFRSNYRAIRSHCLLMDVSYLTIIEIQGTEQDISVGLSKCTSGKCGPTFMAKSYTATSREGSVTLFQPDGYPNKAIANVTFLWKPKTDDVRTLWIWTHPTAYEDVLGCLLHVFDVRIPEKLPSTFPIDKVTVKSLKDKINRFKLIGPLSSCVLADALRDANKIAEGIPITDKENIDCTPSKKIKLDCDLVKKNNDGGDMCLVRDDETLSGLSSRPPCMYPNGVAFGVTVFDPRMNIPRIRTKSVFQSQGSAVENWRWDLASSPLWEGKNRKNISLSFLSDHQINEVKSKSLVPEMESHQRTNFVYILIIQQPGKDGFGAGWDVIIPSRWAMAFWRSFILRGARAGGLHEMNHMQLEMQTLKFFLPPDSCSPVYASAVEKDQKDLEERYFKIPPSKRPNYIKLGIFKPFERPWNVVVKSKWVIRDLKLLIHLKECLKYKRKFTLPYYINGIVPISLKCFKGRPNSLARIYLPMMEDFKNNVEIKEPIHEDAKKSKRQEIREKNKKLLKSWRRERIKVKKGGESKWTESDIEMLKESKKNLMRKSWFLDEPVENLRTQVGFVTVGDFQFISGNGVALGYVKLASIVQILDFSVSLKVSPMLLLRNTHQRLYQKASFEILLDSHG